MIPDKLTIEERTLLLELARSALKEGVKNHRLPDLDWARLPERLKEPGATFVTLTIDDDLRGCIGALEAHQPLAQDVIEHAVAAALEDYRFVPVEPEEIDQIEIEISYLTDPQKLEYILPEDLCHCLRPHVDGVILKYGGRRATFLPQVWEKIPDASLFLSYLCEKMGYPPLLWRQVKMDVFIYQVEEFKEKKEKKNLADG